MPETLTAEQQAAADKAKADAELAARKKAEEDAAARAQQSNAQREEAFKHRLAREKKKLERDLFAALGVKDVEELKAKIASPPSTVTPPANGGAAAPGNGHGAAAKKLEQENAQLRAENERLKAQVREEQAHRQRVYTNGLIDVAATRAGMKDPVYIRAAREILTEEIRKKGKSENVDLDAFFVKLKSERPAMFEATSRPANTGTGGTAPASPPAGGSTTVKLAKDMTDEEYAAERRKLGLSPR